MCFEFVLICICLEYHSSEKKIDRKLNVFTLTRIYSDSVGTIHDLKPQTDLIIENKDFL